MLSSASEALTGVPIHTESPSTGVVDAHVRVQNEGAPMLSAASEAPSGTTTNTQIESHLLQHARTRRLGALDEEQVEVGPLLGRGSFGRVYKGMVAAFTLPAFCGGG